MAVSGTMSFNRSIMTVDTPSDLTLTLTNTGTSIVNVKTITLFATSNGIPATSVVFGTITSPNNALAIPASGGQLNFSSSVVAMSPNGSPGNQASAGWVATTGDLIGCTVYTDGTGADAVVNFSQTISPTQVGAAALAAAGQFLFASNLNSPNWLYFF